MFNILKSFNLIKNTGDLIDAAKIFSTAIVSNRSKEEMDILSKGKFERQRFYIVIASIAIACHGFTYVKYRPNEIAIIENTLIKKIKKWDPDALRALNDCADFVKSYIVFLKKSDTLSYEAAYGSWVIWNLLNRQPEGQNEIDLVKKIGAEMFELFFSWWKK